MMEEIGLWSAAVYFALPAPLRVKGSNRDARRRQSGWLWDFGRGRRGHDQIR